MLGPLNKVQAGNIHLNLIIDSYKIWICNDFTGKKAKKGMVTLACFYH